jgi:hypothetical protein
LIYRRYGHRRHCRKHAVIRTHSPLLLCLRAAVLLCGYRAVLAM